MTKYILYGGHPKNKENTKEFFQEMARDIVKKDITIIYVPYGKTDKENVEEYYDRNKTSCIHALPKKHISFVLAKENPQEFLDQMHEADIIYLGGGNDEIFKAFLSQIPLNILKKHFEGKVIAGSSAGANVLAMYYYTNDRQRVEEGLGILPIKTICHYTEEKESRLEELENYKEHLTSFALPENYFVVIQ